MSYLLDTNILSEPVRPVPNPHVLRRIHEAGGALTMAAITWHELMYGVIRLPDSRRRTALEHYLFEVVQREIPILPYDAEAAAWFAYERVRLSRVGLSPSYPDGQVAAVAATNNLILVTRNVDDFEGYSGLKIENWFV